MASRENMQKYSLNAEETQKKLASTSLGSPTQKKLKMTDPEEEEDSIWEREARKLYVPKVDEGWRPWSVREYLLINAGHANVITKYGAVIFEDPVDFVVDDDDEEQVNVVADPADAVATDEVQVDDVTNDPADVAATTEDPAHVDATEEDPMEEEEDPEEEQDAADQGIGVPDDDANALVDHAASPNATVDASAVSSSDSLPDNP